MKPNSKRDVADTLKRRVLSMEIAPGQLLDEVALAANFGISRTPMREIIQRLCGEGYLTQEENRGAKVASMELSTLRHFYQAAPMIYASMARLAAEQATSQQIELLKQIQLAYRESINKGRGSETAMHNHRFHQMIGEMGASPYLMPSLNRLLIDHTRIAQIFYRSKSPDGATRIEKAADQHDAMIEAIANHSASDAVDLTLQHWELSRGRMQEFVSPDPLPFNQEEQANAI